MVESKETRARRRRRKYDRDTKARYLAEMDANQKDPRHGTNAGYTYGCRCVDCVEAQRRYHRERARYLRVRRWRRAGIMPKKSAADLLAEMAADMDHEDHGTCTGYLRGCKCDACREAYNAYKRDHYARKRGEDPPRREKPLTAAERDARELMEGLKAYQRWLKLGGTPQGWREWHPAEWRSGWAKR